MFTGYVVPVITIAICDTFDDMHDTACLMPWCVFESTFSLQAE